MKGNISMSKCGVSDILENKVTAITDEATDDQYPTAKAVYDAIIGNGGNIGNDGIVVKDTTNSVDYIAKLRLINGKPVIKYVETKEK